MNSSDRSALAFPLEHRDTAHLDEGFVRAFVQHINRNRLETQPDDPPTRAEELIGQIAHLPPSMQLDIWNLPGADGPEAHAFMRRLSLDTNQHVAELDLVVEPHLRRRGIGRALLERAVEYAHDHGRTMIMLSTSDRVPAGEPFLERFGFTRGLENRTNQLDLTNLPEGLLNAWTTRKVDGYTLEIWHGDIPEANIDEFAALSDVMNSAPKDDLEIEDFYLTPELIRQMQQLRRAGGRDLLTAVVRSEAGELVGLNELSWRISSPGIVNQGGTGVRPEHRGHGLGRWLKAANVQRLMQVNPQARFIRTGNANSNAPMLKINTEMGFKPYIASTVWQGETTRVLDKLRE